MDVFIELFTLIHTDCSLPDYNDKHMPILKFALKGFLSMQ